MKAAAATALALVVLAGCTAPGPTGDAVTSSTAMASGSQPERPVYEGPLRADLYTIYLFQRNGSVQAAAPYVAEDRMFGNVTVQGGHVELRFGRDPTSQPSMDAYPVVMSCTRWWDPNFQVDLPVASFGQCQAPYEAGTYVLRAHAWAEQTGTRMDWWSQETTLTVS